MLEKKNTVCQCVSFRLIFHLYFRKCMNSLAASIHILLKFCTQRAPSASLEELHQLMSQSIYLPSDHQSILQIFYIKVRFHWKQLQKKLTTIFHKDTYAVQKKTSWLAHCRWHENRTLIALVCSNSRSIMSKPFFHSFSFSFIAPPRRPAPKESQFHSMFLCCYCFYFFYCRATLMSSADCCCDLLLQRMFKAQTYQMTWMSHNKTENDRDFRCFSVSHSLWEANAKQHLLAEWEM